MAHVFIVDDQTLSIHLKYGFAGTGAKDFVCDFIFDNNTQISPNRERLLAGMLADISRLRIGDKVLFYLQQNSNHEGLFFGEFEIASIPFIARDNYLNQELGKNLTFRVLIRNIGAFPVGATERECLDSLEGISYPYQLCWSLIYRKLKGNRGCTMITEYEYQHIVSKLKINNANNAIIKGDLSFDPNKVRIEQSDIHCKYDGMKFPINIVSRLIYKYKKNNAFETHLQAYISQNAESISWPDFEPKLPVTWIGNEVSCGVGMQSIDIMLMKETSDELHILIGELKDELPTEAISRQLAKYIQWTSEYLIPNYNKRIYIHPVIVAPMPNETYLMPAINIRKYLKPDLLKANLLSPLKYVGFTISDTIDFDEYILGE